MLLPDKTVLASILSRYRSSERRVLAEPHNAVVRRRFEDLTYTLCVLMGCRTAAEAVVAAEFYLGADQGETRSPRDGDLRYEDFRYEEGGRREDRSYGARYDDGPYNARYDEGRFDDGARALGGSRTPPPAAAAAAAVTPEP